MENRTKIKYFSFVAILVAVIYFVILFPKNRVYRGEVQILLISRNNVVDEKIDSMTENAKNIPTTLSFYDRVIKTYEINDPSKSFPSQKRKDYWNSIMKAQRVDGSNIIRLTAYEKNRDQAEKRAGIYAKELIDTLARYYNIKYQLDSRIIDEPIISFDFFRSVLPTATKSIFWGIIAGIFDIILISVIPETEIKKRMFIPKISKSIFAKNNNLPEYTEPDYFPFTHKETKGAEMVTKEEKKEAPRVIKPSTPEKKSAAPENLPFADESEVEEKLYAGGSVEKTENIPAISQEEVRKTEEKKEDDAKKDIFREATPEEVKERLNKLLSGKL